MIHELRVLGVVPVVAHPERNLVFAHERVRKVWGAEAEEGLFVANPKALLAGEELPWAG